VTVLRFTPQPERGDWTLLHAGYEDTLAEAARRGGADLIAFSPPYCDARTYGAAVSWTDSDYARLGDHVFAALKPGGHALVNVDAPVREWRPGFGTERGFHPWRLMLDWAERVGFRVPDRLAFGRQGLPGEYAGRFRNDWEPLLWFQRPGADGFMDRGALAEMGASGAYLGSRSRTATKDGWRDRPMTGEASENGIKHRGTFWGYNVCGNGHTGAPEIEAEDHPARWPYRLARDLVLCFSPPGGLVVDPFVGAGTTGKAAIDNGRRFIGGDLYFNPKGEPWASVAHRILLGATAQSSLFGGGDEP
jgi:site-specific DNA-methyltransferase (adenine-specific)